MWGLWLQGSQVLLTRRVTHLFQPFHTPQHTQQFFVHISEFLHHQGGDDAADVQPSHSIPLQKSPAPLIKPVVQQVKYEQQLWHAEVRSGSWKVEEVVSRVRGVSGDFPFGFYSTMNQFLIIPCSIHSDINCHLPGTNGPCHIVGPPLQLLCESAGSWSVIW